MKNNKLSYIILGSVIVLIIAQLLNSILAVSSFETTYKSSLISKYKIVAKELERQIETSINFGKPIYRFSRMDVVFENVISQEKGIRNLYVTNTDGKVLYSTDSASIQKDIPVDVIPNFKRTENAKSDDFSEIILSNEKYYISVPIFFAKKDLQGIIFLQFDKKIITENVNEMIMNNVRVLVVIMSVAILILMFAIRLVNKIEVGSDNKEKEEDSRIRTRNFIVIALVLLTSQLVYTLMSNKYFENKFIEIENNNVGTLSNVVKGNIENYLNLGIKIEKLKKADSLLSERLKNFEDCNELKITDNDGNLLFAADSKGQKSSVYDTSFKSEKIDLKENAYQKIVPLNAKGVQKGNLVLTINTAIIKSRINELLLDAVTIIIVSFVFSFELLGLLAIFINRKTVTTQKSKSDNIKIIRATAFIFFFAELVTLSFLPLYIKKVYEENPLFLFGLSREGALSIPISTYILGVAIFVPIAGSLSKRFSIKNIFFGSVALQIIGSIATAFSWNIYSLIAARLISGIGYGGAMINGTNLIINYTEKDNRATGFGNWSAGYAAASVCAIPIGGVIVNRLGFRPGILLASILSILFVIFIAVFIKDNSKADLLSKVEAAKEKLKLSDFTLVFKNKNLVALMFLSSIPVQIAFIGVFQYSFPLYMDKMGVTTSNIGRILTIFGLISLLTPLISKLADKTNNDKKFIIIGNAIIGSSLLLFIWEQNLIIVITVIFAIGFGAMFGDAVEESFVSATEEAKAIGETKLLSIYTTVTKVFSAIVPLFAGLLIMFLGYSQSIVIVGGIILVCLVLFGLFSHNTRK